MIAPHPVDDAHSPPHKLRGNFGALLLRSLIAAASFLCFDLITERAPVPPLPLGAGQFAIAVFVKSLLRTVKHGLHLQFLDL